MKFLQEYLFNFRPFISFLVIIHVFVLNIWGQDNMIPPEKLVRLKIRLPERLTMGIMGGNNMSIPAITHIPENTYGFKPNVRITPGWQIGLTGNISVTGKYFLLFNIQYLNYSAYSKYDLADYRDTYQEHLHIFSFPSAIAYKMGKGGIKYYPIAGISINCLLDSKIDYCFHPYPDIPTYTYKGNVDMISDRNRLIYGGILGAGFTYQVRKYFMILDIRYCIDLRNYINTGVMKTIQIESEYGFPFPYQSPGFRMHGFFINLGIMKARIDYP
ncbi:MAG: hypothetical protein AMS27_04900 [Bacteroides sp. SM23_62_1]|nr:MAG: hypothetical protein AMS27_04900 [Bacteroides sp. SM23_62_1]